MRHRRPSFGLIAPKFFAVVLDGDPGAAPRTTDRLSRRRLI